MAAPRLIRLVQVTETARRDLTEKDVILPTEGRIGSMFVGQYAVHRVTLHRRNGDTITYRLPFDHPFYNSDDH